MTPIGQSNFRFALRYRPDNSLKWIVCLLKNWSGPCIGGLGPTIYGLSCLCCGPISWPPKYYTRSWRSASFWWNLTTFTVYALWYKQEKPTNCAGRRCAGQYFSRPTLMRIHWIFLVHLQLLWLHKAYQFKVLLRLLSFGCKLKGEFAIPNFAGDHSRLPNTSQYKVLLYLPPFGRNSNVKLCLLPIRPPFGGPRGPKMVPIEMWSPNSIRLLFTLL